MNHHKAGGLIKACSICLIIPKQEVARGMFFLWWNATLFQVFYLLLTPIGQSKSCGWPSPSQETGQYTVLIMRPKQVSGPSAASKGQGNIVLVENWEWKRNWIFADQWSNLQCCSCLQNEESTDICKRVEFCRYWVRWCGFHFWKLPRTAVLPLKNLDHDKDVTSMTCQKDSLENFESLLLFFQLLAKYSVFWKFTHRDKNGRPWLRHSAFKNMSISSLDVVKLVPWKDLFSVLLVYKYLKINLHEDVWGLFWGWYSFVLCIPGWHTADIHSDWPRTIWKGRFLSYKVKYLNITTGWIYLQSVTLAFC